MKNPRRRGTFAFLCYLGATTTTTNTFPTPVSGFHAPCAAGRIRRRPAGEALRPPRRLQQQHHHHHHHHHQPQQQEERQRSLNTARGGATAMGAVGAQQQQQHHRNRQQRETRGWGWGLENVMTASSAGGGGTGGFWRGVAHGSRKGLSTRRTVGVTSSSSWVLRCAADGDDESNNYGSADYSEYGYEPEYELQGDEKLDADAETLAKWRLEKLLANDRWQFGKYGTQTVGNWIGSWQEYVAQKVSAGGYAEDEEAGSMIGLVPGRKFVANTRVSRRVIESAGGAKIFEHEQGPAAGGEGQGAVGYDSAACPQPVVEVLFTDSFRGGNGTQVVGNTYTTADLHPQAAAAAAAVAAEGSGDDLWLEMGLRAREKDVRIRCVFQYGPEARGAKAPEGESPASGGPGLMALRRVFLVREGLDRLPPQDAAAEPELYGAAGKGLYDPPSLSRSPLYLSMYAEGGLTLRFPLEVEAGHAGVFSVDWTAGSSRYQADRVFDVLDGSIRRLEVTEIGTDDAETFLPMEKF